MQWFSLVIGQTPGQNTSRQCSIFGRIGNQWVTISNPEMCNVQTEFITVIDQLGCDEYNQCVPISVNYISWK